MSDLPLLLQACLGKQFGEIINYEGGKVCVAGFIYLTGQVDHNILLELKERYHNRMFICLSKEWEKSLLQCYPDIIKWTRYQMSLDPADVSMDQLETIVHSIPDEYRLAKFDHTAYELKPFHHGMLFPSYEAFKRDGSGAVVWYQNQIVASASSFLFYQGMTELDVSTREEHRGKGLASACAAAMLMDCEKRHIEVHWDAQNKASERIAMKLGYHLLYRYQAYTFMEPHGKE